MRNLDLDALQIFKAVADEGGVRARQLNRVQSNVSTRLKQLEAALDAPCSAARTGAWCCRTRAACCSYADRLLRLSAEAQQAVRDAPRGTLRLGTMESTAAARLPPVLAAYHAAWPQVRIELVTGTSAALAAKVRDYELEAAFVAEPFPAEGLASTEAFAETLVLISPRAWPEIAAGRSHGDRLRVRLFLSPHPGVLARPRRRGAGQGDGVRVLSRDRRLRGGRYGRGHRAALRAGCAGRADRAAGARPAGQYGAARTRLVAGR